MSDLKPKATTIQLGDKEYGLLFTINAIDEIQDKFDCPISEIGELMQDYKKTFKIVRFLLTVLINEAIDDAERGEAHVDERFIGRKLTPDNISSMKIKVFSSFKSGLPASEETESPNVKSE